MVRNIENGPASQDPRDNLTPLERRAREDNAKLIGETIDDTLQLMLDLEAEKKTNPLLAARRRLIDLSNAKVSEESTFSEANAAELAQVQQEVMNLEAEQRDQQDPSQ